MKVWHVCFGVDGEGEGLVGVDDIKGVYSVTIFVARTPRPLGRGWVATWKKRF